MTISENITAYNLYQKGYSANKIGKILGYTDHTILNAIRSIDPSAVRSKAGFKPSWNENYFETIDDEFKSYFLGFLMGDGNVTRRLKSQPVIRLQISNKDSYILHILKEVLCVNNKIEYSIRDNTNTLRFHSSRMASDLEKYGIVPNKTGKERFPYDKIPEKLVHHFLRGFFDADGWFSISNNKTKIKFMIGWAKNIKMLKDIKKYLNDHVNGLTDVKIHKYSEDKGYKGYAMLLYTKRQNVLDIAEFLYQNATIYLDRKRKVYETMLTIPRGRVKISSL